MEELWRTVVYDFGTLLSCGGMAMLGWSVYLQYSSFPPHSHTE
eukprot:g68298.t1